MLRRGLATALNGRYYSPSLFLRTFSNVSQPSPSPSVNNVSCGLHAATLTVDDAVIPGSRVDVKHSILQPRVIVYDGVCNLCHNGVKWVIKTDRDEKLKFCCLQSKAAEPYLKMSGLGREDVLKRFLFIEGPGLYHQGSAAALRVLSHLPPPYSALSCLMTIPRPLRDAVYDYIAKRRYDWFGKGSDCLVLQNKELLERFIDREEILDRENSDK